VKALTAVAGFGLMLLASNAQAEWYIAGQAGGNFAESMGNVRGTGALRGSHISDLGLQNAVMYGGKVGYYLPGSMKWLGFESEAYTTTPNFKAQNVTISNSAGSSSSFVPGSTFRVTTWAFNVVARYPGEVFQPYVGAGVGVFWADVTNSGPTDTSPGANAFAGARFFLTKQVAFFGEYKFNHARFSLSDGTSGFRGDYNAHMAIAGISFHFQK
jgi:hypothetical protein